MTRSKCWAVALTLFMVAVAFTAPVEAAELTRVELGTSAIGADTALSSIDTDGDTMLNNDRTVIIVRDTDTDGSGVDVTIPAKVSSVNTTFGELSISDITFTVTDGDSYVKAPQAAYNNDNGRVEINYAASSDTTGIEAGGIERTKN